MVDRRGEYGLDGSYPRLGLLVQAALEVAAGAMAVRRGRPVLAAASGVASAGLGAVAVGGLYSSRRGKFEVWSELLDELELRGDDVSVRRLGWRMSFGSPINVTGLVCARKPGY